jgi:hypothetical protein
MIRMACASRIDVAAGKALLDLAGRHNPLGR